MQNFIELDMKKFSNPKALTFGVWRLKTSLGQFGAKVFGKDLPLTGPHFLKNHEMNALKS